MVDHSRDAPGGGMPQPQYPGPAGGETGQVRGRTQREIIWTRFKRHKLALVCAVILLVLYVAAFVGPWLAPYGFAEQNFTAINEAPSAEHPMGTDRLGRDQFSRVLYGGQVSLLVGLGAGVGSTVIGAAIGIFSGYFGRWVDTAGAGFTDFVIALPFLPVLIVLGAVFTFSPQIIALVLAALLWPTVARLVRAQVLTLRESEFVQAARSIGVSSFRIMLRHILPNVVGVMVVQATLVTGIAIISESILSFLGLGIQPPTPSWGNMLQDARTAMRELPWLTIFPSIMIITTVICVNFLGDGLRDALDPKAVE
ncbi:MAG: ABC transporter permease [Rubrobacter sp.]|nr:ABC transporter permease [Rubrobacter sp.]